MTLDQSALLEVVDALKATEVDDRVRQAAETIYQALIEAELTAVWAPRRSSAPSSGWRSATGTARGFDTTDADLDLRIPKLRTGSFFPSLLERRWRVDQALFRGLRRRAGRARRPGQSVRCRRQVSWWFPAVPSGG
jgi:putative transposase